MLKKLRILLDNEIDPAFAQRAEFIFKILEKEKPKRVLDAGCGRGFYPNAVSLYSFPREIVGIDINSEYLKQAKDQISDKRVKLLKKSIYSTDFPDNYFDLVICSEVLEHLTNEKKALGEISRILKKNGTLLITVPGYNFPFLWDPINWILMRFFKTHVNKNIWFLAGIWAGHERLYEVNDLGEKIKNAGFSVLKINGVISFCWPFSHFILYGLGKNIVERLNIRSFSRFQFKKNNFNYLLARLFSIPTKFITGDSSVDIIAQARKN